MREVCSVSSRQGSCRYAWWYSSSLMLLLLLPMRNIRTPKRKTGWPSRLHWIPCDYLDLMESILQICLEKKRYSCSLTIQVADPASFKASRKSNDRYSMTPTETHVLICLNHHAQPGTPVANHDNIIWKSTEKSWGLLNCVPGSVVPASRKACSRVADLCAAFLSACQSSHLRIRQTAYVKTPVYKNLKHENAERS